MTPVWVELVCGHCAKVEVGEFTRNGQVPVRRLKKTARKLGWLFKHNEAFCSEHCEAHFEGKRE